MNDLLRHIADKVGSLVALTDEDYGQLDALKNGESTYPVAFPCVLVSVSRATWESLNANTQRGQLTVSVRLAADCRPAAGAEDTAAQRAAQRQRLVHQLNEAVQGWYFEGTAAPATRTQSTQEALPGYIKVYGQEYAVTVMESGAEG